MINFNLLLHDCNLNSNILNKNPLTARTYIKGCMNTKFLK